MADGFEPHSTETGLPVRAWRAIAATWRELTRPASADFIGIPHQRDEDDPATPNRHPGKGQTLEYADFHQWRHF